MKWQGNLSKRQTLKYCDFTITKLTYVKITDFVIRNNNFYYSPKLSHILILLQVYIKTLFKSKLIFSFHFYSFLLLYPF